MTPVDSHSATKFNTPGRDRSYLCAGWLLIVNSLLIVFAMLHHPRPRAHDDLLQLGHPGSHLHAINQWVHGYAIAAMLILCVSLSYLTDRLGKRGIFTRLGEAGFRVGAVFMMLAASVSGFIVPGFLEHVADDSTATEMAPLVLDALREANQTADRMGVVFMSTGILFWSLAGFQRSGFRTVVGWIGLGVASLGLVGWQTDVLGPTVDGVILFVSCLLVWLFAVGVSFLRSPQPLEAGVLEAGTQTTQQP